MIRRRRGLYILWADEARRLLRPSSSERIYANYQSYAGKGTAEAVFGSNYSRLVALKNKYDPANFSGGTRTLSQDRRE